MEYTPHGYEVLKSWEDKRYAEQQLKWKTEYNLNKKMKNIEQLLIENIADFLDQEDVLIEEAMSNIRDSQPREKTDLHIKMAKAAMEVYKSEIVSTSSK